MIEWIVAWYLIGFVSAVLVWLLDVWTDYWNYGWEVKPFTYRNLVQCLFGAWAGPLVTFFLVVGVFFHSGILLKRVFRKHFDLDRPVFKKRNKKQG